jgi:rRNA maturation endonuclease Nob1
MEYAKHIRVRHIYTYRCEGCGEEFDSDVRLHICKCIDCRAKEINRLIDSKR